MMSKDLRQNDELSRRIAADLKERAKDLSDGDSDKSEDLEEAAGTKKTGRFAWVWLVLVVLAAISIVLIVMI